MLLACTRRATVASSGWKRGVPIALCLRIAIGSVFCRYMKKYINVYIYTPVDITAGELCVAIARQVHMTRPKETSLSFATRY